MLGLFKAIQALIEGDASVRKVADDAVLTAELLLLFRVILADGQVTQSELDRFQAICRDSFGLAEESFGAVMRYLKDYGYETDAAQAIEMFREMDIDRRRALAAHVADIAQADQRLDTREFHLIERLADRLGLAPEDFVPRAAG